MNKNAMRTYPPGRGPIHEQPPKQEAMESGLKDTDQILEIGSDRFISSEGPNGSRSSRYFYDNDKDLATLESDIDRAEEAVDRAKSELQRVENELYWKRRALKYATWDRAENQT